MDKRTEKPHGMAIKSKKNRARCCPASPNLELRENPSWPRVQPTYQTDHRDSLGREQGKGGNWGNDQPRRESR